jgi:DNA-directed RNA polymerase specialized sigma subunit
MDIYLVPVGGATDNGEEEKMEFDFADTRENPEENVLRREGELTAAGFVDNFLNNLNKSVRGKTKQYNRMINVLWYCYLISDSGTQLEVAEMLGVSDSLVSDYRKRIESNLQQLSFNGVNEARQFEKALRRTVARLSRLKNKRK